ncbi:MAG: hypothetical protein H0W61_08970 [Bacteroidetes bacterium]|nr:hypothetical protein [Bacteroidota bacterium]
MSKKRKAKVDNDVEIKFERFGETMDILANDFLVQVNLQRKCKGMTDTEKFEFVMNDETLVRRFCCFLMRVIHDAEIIPLKENMHMMN